MRALLVDDDQLDRKLICGLLKDTGLPIDVTEAEDAVAAMDAVTAEEFDCLLVDQRMPGMMGTEFIRAFRDLKDTPRTPILVLSGDQADKVTTEEAVGAGGDFFMAKQDLTSVRLKAVLRCFGPSH